MQCWTSDKQELSIGEFEAPVDLKTTRVLTLVVASPPLSLLAELFVQVKILSEKIPEIYDKYQFNYYATWSQKIQMALKQTTKDYNTESMFEERGVVTAAIKAEIENYLEDEVRTHTEWWLSSFNASLTHPHPRAARSPASTSVK